MNMALGIFAAVGLVVCLASVVIQLADIKRRLHK
jgi:hypothetical protein